MAVRLHTDYLLIYVQVNRLGDGRNKFEKANQMKMWPRLFAFCILAVGFLTTAASADTIYTFTGTDSNGAIGFQLVAPTFVTQLPGTAFSAGQFSSCTNCNTGFLAAIFTPIPSTLTFFDSQGGSGFFLFSTGAFSAPGIYNSLLGKGTLTVSVPEPATILMGFLSLAMILGVVAFRRDSQLQLSRQ